MSKVVDEVKDFTKSPGRILSAVGTIGMSEATRAAGKLTGSSTISKWTDAGGALDSGAKKMGGWDNVAMMAGLGTASILTGGTASALYALGAGAAGYAGTKEYKAKEAAKEAAAESARINAANEAAISEANRVSLANRRANLLSMRKQLAPNVGGRSAAGGASGTNNNSTPGGIVLG